jgi:hypothetical protein
MQPRLWTGPGWLRVSMRHRDIVLLPLEVGLPLQEPEYMITVHERHDDESDEPLPRLPLPLQPAEACLYAVSGVCTTVSRSRAIHPRASRSHTMSWMYAAMKFAANSRGTSRMRRGGGGAPAASHAAAASGTGTGTGTGMLLSVVPVFPPAEPGRQRVTGTLYSQGWRHAPPQTCRARPDVWDLLVH